MNKLAIILSVIIVICVAMFVACDGHVDRLLWENEDGSSSGSGSGSGSGNGGGGKSAVTTGSANVLSTAGRTSCNWVQLWENGPKWAEFSVGATITDYAQANGTGSIGIQFNTIDYINKTGTGTEIPYCGATCGQLYGFKGTTVASGTDYNSVADTATALWGSDWEMPSKADFEDLYKNVTLNKTAPSEGLYTIWTYYNGSSSQYKTGCTLAGWKVSGKGDYANNSIFLPLSGYTSGGITGEISNYDEFWFWTEDSYYFQGGKKSFNISAFSSGKKSTHLVRPVLKEVNQVI